jgi:hypothetical protein
VPAETKNVAKNQTLELLRAEEVSSYAKYRIVHHLIKERRSGRTIFRFVESSQAGYRDSLKRILLELLRVTDFELNIASLYALKVLGLTPIELRNAAQVHAPKPLGEPLKNALFFLEERVESSVSTMNLAIEGEPDEVPEPY